jgi:DNA topoisomerase-3
MAVMMRTKLHDLPSLQKLCSSRFGWPAKKTLDVAQELYDGQDKKIITYPRAEVRYLPQSLISDVPRIVAGLRVGQSFAAIPVPEPPVIRTVGMAHRPASAPPIIGDLRHRGRN